MKPIFSHVMLGANDLARMAAFYDAALTPLGLVRASTEPEPEDHPPGATWTRPGAGFPEFIVRAPFDRRPASVGNGVQVSLSDALAGDGRRRLCRRDGGRRDRRGRAGRPHRLFGGLLRRLLPRARGQQDPFRPPPRLRGGGR